VTNITHEHLDFHGSYEEYRRAKSMLFRGLLDGQEGAAALPKPGIAAPSKTAVLNRDDSSYRFLAAIPVQDTVTYGLHPPEETPPGTHLTAHAVRHTPSVTEFAVQVSAGAAGQATGDLQLRAPLQLRTQLIGDFNVSNILAATGAALALGIDAACIRTGVEAMTGIAGRMERIVNGQPFGAIVDFAHTPNALARALETVRTLTLPGGRLIVVFGCAGLRDREKRRLMGEVAVRLADYAVITAEDPRTEDLADILAETAVACVSAGRVEGQDFVLVPDRQRAILHAVERARPGDVLIVCGKGHERSMCFGAIEYPWRDQDALRWALATPQGNAAGVPPYVLPTW
jgi:UDP-N-acetylmuramoyl-L-alanyl-D-glutamate--2,6-diaminopimelate ligase